MPFREKWKKAFGGGSTKESAAYMEGKDPKVPVYKPGETPPSKYRGPWNQQHQDNLQSFSFSNAFGRRKSSQGASDYSPTATRRQSAITTGRKSTQRDRGPSHVGQVVENVDGDDDPANVGRGRPGTVDEAKQAVQPDHEGGALEQQETVQELEPQETITNSTAAQRSDNRPFTDDELTKAVTALKIQDQA